MRFVVPLAFLLAACSTAPQAEKPAITVYADSALTEAFTKIGTEFEAAQGVRVKFVFGSSSALEKQIDSHVDVYASASPETMKHPSKVFALNRLVIATRPGGPKDVAPRLDGTQPSFAMCVAAAPCGAAALAAFSENGFGAAMPQPKATGQDVKETLAKVKAGEVDAAIVYATDVKANPDLTAHKLGASEPGEQWAKAMLKFPISVVSGTPDAKKFYDYVFSRPGRIALSDAGFELP
ncbi:molybdate ABC transporter substrate-binding protein [Lentzea alba]|uniref:molybdate ABC transporter substrate-binding protein n=1 Tax=Lentzea alba TaxID=2714351 RepID=UPI0039BFC5C0